METNSGLIVERDGHIVTLTLNRPERLNALSFALMDELSEVWPTLDADPEIRVIVMTGTGRGFCSGLDLGAMAQLAADGEYPTERRKPAKGDAGSGPTFTARQAHVYKPVVTAVNGVCAGAGLHFVVDADIVICGESATFVDTHLNVGRVDVLEPIGLARKIGLAPVLRMMLLGRDERLSARRALEIGLVSEVVPDDQLAERTREIATGIAGLAPLATRMSLRAVWESLEHGLEEGLEGGNRALADYAGHPDEVEGATAFAQKREPNWTT